MKSDSIKNLAEALRHVQRKLKDVELDKENSFFHSKYSTLRATWGVCRELLSENGLSVVQTFKVVDKGNLLVTTLLHISGEWIEGEVLLNPVKNDPQQVGSATTYMRRYSLASLLGIVSDEDDDGVAASQGNASQQVSHTPANRPTLPQETPKPQIRGVFAAISLPQAKRLYAIAKSHKWEDDVFKVELKDKFGYANTKDIKPEDYQRICDFFSQGEIEDVPFG